MVKTVWNRKKGRHTFNFRIHISQTSQSVKKIVVNHFFFYRKLKKEFFRDWRFSFFWQCSCSAWYTKNTQSVSWPVNRRQVWNNAKCIVSLLPIYCLHFDIIFFLLLHWTVEVDQCCFDFEIKFFMTIFPL